jgi:hypothetical protein
MTSHMLRLLIIPAITSIIVTSAFSQIKVPPLSAPTTLTKQIGFTTITITYESPSARWREESDIFGALVPFGKIWRTGAGPGTKISFDKKVTIAGKPVAPGIYSLYSIPDKDEWVIILNTDTGAYNVFHHDPAKDVVRVTSKASRTSRYYPSLNFDIDFVPNNATVFISWLNTQVSFGIDTGLDEQISTFIKQNLLSGKETDYQLYQEAVIYYEWHNGDRDELMHLINRGMQLHKSRFWYYSKIALLEKQNRIDDAITCAKQAIELIETSPAEEGYAKSDLIADFTNWIDKLKAKKTSH